MTLTIERLDPWHQLGPALVSGHQLAEVHHVERVLLHAGVHDVLDHGGRGPVSVHHSHALFDIYWDLEEQKTLPLFHLRNLEK